MERDPIIEALRALPKIAPPAELDAAVKAAAHAELAGETPSLWTLILYRGLLPVMLSGVTATYLLWAVQAASALY